MTFKNQNISDSYGLILEIIEMNWFKAGHVKRVNLGQIKKVKLGRIKKVKLGQIKRVQLGPINR